MTGSAVLHSNNNNTFWRPRPRPQDAQDASTSSATHDHTHSDVTKTSNRRRIPKRRRTATFTPKRRRTTDKSFKTETTCLCSVTASVVVAVLQQFVYSLLFCCIMLPLLILFTLSFFQLFNVDLSMLMTLGGWVVTTASETMRLMYDMKAMTTWMMTSTTAVTTIDTNVLYKKSVDYLLEQEFGSVRNELGNYLLDHEDPIRLLHFLGVVVVTSSIMLPILSKLLTAQVQRHRQRQKERSFSQSCFKQRLTTQLGPYWEIDRNTPSYDPEQSRLESQLGQYWDSPTSLTSLPPPNTPHPNDFEREEEEELRTIISPGNHNEDDAIPDIARVLTFDEDDEDDDTENDFTNNADMDSDDDANADNRSRSTTASFNTINDRDDRDDDDDDAWNIDTVITTMTKEFQIIMNEWNVPTPMKTRRMIKVDDGRAVESSSPPLSPPPTKAPTASPIRPTRTQQTPIQTPTIAPSTPVLAHDQDIADDFMLSVFKRKFTRRTIN